MIQAQSYETGHEGPKLAFMGAVHGNEICGTQAIHQLMTDIENGAVKLARGSLLLIPVANPEACRMNRRFVDENLNRVFLKSSHPKSYESHIANELTDMLSSCDILVDFHSNHMAGWPFALHFDFFSKQEEDMIRAMGLAHVVQGWESAYARSFPQMNMGQTSHSSAFMHSQGKIGMGVECGQHADTQSVVVARNIMDRMLVHSGIVKGGIDYPDAQAMIEIRRVYLRRSEHDGFESEFTHGQPIQKGQQIARYGDGGTVQAEEDGLILFPRPDCPIGEEWFYTGRNCKISPTG
ncbi:MAG: succinylglutamate desuccinylase/aspartoacylase family protein [Alphaproteobacteria bacterium]|nr:MAG: succinylglutamate desuccinylase/aspartoacylase family protein [Alphaproteobacteria bacterium]